MSNELLQKLERKIHNAVETIELLKLQIEEMAEKNSILSKENVALKNKQSGWEKNLQAMLEKLNSVSGADQHLTSQKVLVETYDDEEALV